MSIQLEMTVTGGELARALLRDEEEMAYALQEMAMALSTAKKIEDLGYEVGSTLSRFHQEQVVMVLRQLANAIEVAP